MKHKMKKLAMVVSFILALGIKLSAQPQPGTVAAQAQLKTVATQGQSGPVVAQSPSESLLILVLDSSPSVRPYWPEMQSSAKELIRSTPASSSVAVVGIDAEAQKSEIFTPLLRAQALTFVDRLTIGGRLTDLARGTDAALALLQQAHPARCIIIYLTDGKLVVPKSFRNQSGFFELLRREFTPRENVEVIVMGGVGVTLWRKRKNRTGTPTGEIIEAEVPPTDAMREEDLVPRDEPVKEAVPMVVIITASDAVNRRESAQRRVLRVGEQVIVGGTKFAELHLPGLQQARALHLRFDGNSVKVFRLRPQPGETLDDVLLNQAIAPLDFGLSEKDVLRVGGFTLHLVVTNEDEIPDLWTKPDQSPSAHLPMQLTAAGRRPPLRNLGGQNHVNGEEN